MLPQANSALDTLYHHINLCRLNEIGIHVEVHSWFISLI